MNYIKEIISNRVEVLVSRDNICPEFLDNLNKDSYFLIDRKNIDKIIWSLGEKFDPTVNKQLLIDGYLGEYKISEEIYIPILIKSM